MMRYYFSRRHSTALRDKKLTPHLPSRLRVSIKRTLDEHSDWNPYEAENESFQKTENLLKTFWGEETIHAYNEEGKLVPSTLYGLISGGPPARVLDLIEAWCDSVNLDKADACEKELNTLFEIHVVPWRLVNKTIILVDSQYIQEEIISKTQYLLRENSAAGALEEFNGAVSCLTDGQTKEAVINAHKSVESVMKICLGVDGLTFGSLLSKLIKSGIIPDYYKDFLAHFEKLALGAGKERNLPARGHGQGAEPTVVDRSLAEFAVHLAGVINLFIIRRWIESRPKRGEPPVEDDIPF